MASDNDQEARRTAAGAGAAVGLKRVLQKLDQQLAAKNFYEAHQIYRTIFTRFVASKQFDRLLQILYDGALVLLAAGQEASGEDLCRLYVEALRQGRLPVVGAVLDQLESLLAALLPHAKQLDQQAFVCAAVDWSKTVSPGHVRGHPDVHRRFASVLWRHHAYAPARYHFIESNDGEGCAKLLVEYHMSKGYPNEMDMFLAQAVFQYLCRNKKEQADKVFACYVEQHPEIGNGPPFVLPLLNFVWLLLNCIDIHKESAFILLVKAYQPSLVRDPTYMQYIDRIGHVFFGLPPAKTSSRFSIIESIVRGLLNDDAAEESKNDSDDSDQIADDSVDSKASFSPPSKKSNLHEEGLD